MYYQIGSIKLELVLPEELPLESLQAQIPGITKGNQSDICEILTFKFIKGKSYIKKTTTTLTLSGEWNNATKGDISHLVYCWLRQYWINRGYYPVHSLCMGNSLFVGHSGTGKTTLALEALKSQLVPYSFDKTVVSFQGEKVLPILGTQVISVREELNHGLNNLSQIGTNGTRILFKTNQKVSPTGIENIYLFHLQDKRLEINTLSDASSLHELYPYFMDTVKTDAIVGETVFSGNTSKKSKEKLIKELRQWISQGHPLSILIGRPHDIINYLKNDC